MKKTRKPNLNKNLLPLLLGLIFSLALILRFYNFNERIIYGPEQARSLLTGARNVTDKFSLLGQEYFRYTKEGHQLFYSALFTYSLIPLEILFNFDPIPITAYFTLVNLFTGLVLYFVSRKMFGERQALLALVFFLFNSYMIYHSLFLWPYNYLPLLGILSFYMIFLIKENPLIKYSLFLGILTGVGFGLQYLYAIYGLILILLIYYYSGRNFKFLLIFILGFLLGDFPMVIFDIRNNFYHFSTLVGYLIDTLQGRSDASFNYYYLLPIWPVMALLFGVVIDKIIKVNKSLAVFLVAIYLYLNLISQKVNFDRSLGMPENLRWRDIKKTAFLISQDNPTNFNVATLLDFDTRAYILRYPLEAIYQIKPAGVEDYPNADALYVLAKNDFDIKTSDAWEIRSISPFKIIYKKEINNWYVLYKVVEM